MRRPIGRGLRPVMLEVGILVVEWSHTSALISARQAARMLAPVLVIRSVMSGPEPCKVHSLFIIFGTLINLKTINRFRLPRTIWLWAKWCLDVSFTSVVQALLYQYAVLAECNCPLAGAPKSFKSITHQSHAKFLLKATKYPLEEKSKLHLTNHSIQQNE